jgi:undecaprenyl-diphosphatase
MTAPAPHTDARRLPTRATALMIGAAAVVAIGVTAWLATSSGAETAQTGMVRWFNDPPRPASWVLALTNPLLRPVPLVLVSAVLLGCVALTAGSRSSRLEIARAAVIAVLTAEVGAQILKRVADQARPFEVIEGLDSHGYPRDPIGHAYPSAHTAIVVAGVAGLWPWMRTWQRILGIAFALAVALNRLYIGAHWPIDVLGGAAVGMVGAVIAWLTTERWPLSGRSRART